MPLELPSRDVTVYWYLGTDDELALGAQEGESDLGTDIELVARTNEYTPDSIGGEAIWHMLYIALRRSNDDDLTLRFTPIVEDEPGDDIDITLEAVANPTRELLEVGLAKYYPSAADPQISNALRGSTFALEIRTVGTIPAGRLVIEGVELEWELAGSDKESENAA